jgi:hypothetical protein
MYPAQQFGYELSDAFSAVTLTERITDFSDLIGPTAIPAHFLKHGA